MVATLAILTVLALLAAIFAVQMAMTASEATTQVEALKLDLLTMSGEQNAEAILQQGTQMPGMQGTAELLMGSIEKPYVSPWLYVRDSRGVVQGRYRLKLEDEAGKVNLNTASLTEPSKGSGWSTAEVDVQSALGLPKGLVPALVSFRHGLDGKPGKAGIDDDRNNVQLMADKIDNDADGVVDEEDEGVDDPGEYRPYAPTGDDRSFSGVGELLSIVREQCAGMPLAGQREVRRRVEQRTTVHSVDLPGSLTLPNDEPADINTVVARECRRRIDAANLIELFEQKPERRNQLAVDIVDYRDENHVLSTYASTYGVEAICFNEVMANDDSYSATAFLTSLSRNGANGEYVGDRLGPGLDYWKDLCGSSDGARIAFCLTSPYSQATLGGWYRFDPREAWRINNAVIPKSSIDIGASSLSFTLGDVPGPNGITASYVGYNFTPTPLPGGLNWGTHPKTPGYFGNWGWQSLDINYYDELIKLCGKADKLLDGHPKLPPNTFKNSLALIYLWGAGVNKAVGSYKVTSSTPDHHFTCQSTDALTGESISSRLATMGITNNFDFSISFDGWLSAYTVQQPNTANIVMMRSRRPIGNRYYKLMVTRRPKGYWNSDKIPNLGVQAELNFSKFSPSKNKLWWYNDGTPVRTSGNGWVAVNIVSSPEVDWQKDRILEIDLLRMVGPEVVELFNASPRPVSLANWRVICNTGSLATQIGHVRRTAYYDPILREPVEDNNPCVMPGSYFYLVNDTKLFDARFGNADNAWGSANTEKLPVFQMDEDRWGIMYTIEKVSSSPITGDMYELKLKDEHFANNMFALETAQILCDDNDARTKEQGSIHGVIMPLAYPNVGPVFTFILNDVIPASETIDFTTTVVPKPGDKIMVLGLPYRGGLVSLTLKNEYEQVCTRMVDYGVTTATQIEYSNEKADPTQPVWFTKPVASIGGVAEQAMNVAMRAQRNPGWYIKNAPYGSVGELYRVSTPDKFGTLGSGRGEETAKTAIGSLADAFHASSIRLEAAGEGVERSGWSSAADTVDGATMSSVRATQGNWENDQWKGHTLRFLTGPLRGESFPVLGNSESTVYLAETNATTAPRSAPSRKALQPQNGNQFCIGPGYAGTFCYTRTSNVAGEWTWRRRIPARTPCWLYIHGLSDAINTTEFLEENNNAGLAVEVWNWETRKFDCVCQQRKFGKEDCFNAGLLSSAQISIEGDLRIRITAHDVEQLMAKDMSGKMVMKNRRTGFAWFNAASVTPLPIAGRINANTAPAEVIGALPGMTAQIARNVAQGLDGTGAARLKPYRHLGDVLKVKGMTIALFERLANMLCVDSTTYTVEVEAESLKGNANADKDGAYPITAMRTTRFILQAGWSSLPGIASRIRELDRYRK